MSELEDQLLKSLEKLGEQYEADMKALSERVTVLTGQFTALNERINELTNQINGSEDRTTRLIDAYNNLANIMKKHLKL